MKRRAHTTSASPRGARVAGKKLFVHKEHSTTVHIPRKTKPNMLSLAHQKLVELPFPVPFRSESEGWWLHDTVRLDTRTLTKEYPFFGVEWCCRTGSRAKQAEPLTHPGQILPTKHTITSLQRTSEIVREKRPCSVLESAYYITQIPSRRMKNFPGMMKICIPYTLPYPAHTHSSRGTNANP